MNHETSLLSDQPHTNWNIEKITTPFPALNGCYRSRIYASQVNINPLIAACDQLLSLVAVLKTTEYPEDNEKFLQDLAHEIRSFEHRAQIASYQPHIITAARYALCCLLDETIAMSEWGQKKGWSNNNLLTLFHNESDGGERFFTIINRALENISTNLHLIELLYLCLNFGFTGKHRYNDHGQNELVAISNRLYQIIGQYSTPNNKTIFIQEPKIKTEQEQDRVATCPPAIVNPKKIYSIACALAIAISCLICYSFYFNLNSVSKTVSSLVNDKFSLKNGNTL